MRFAVDAHTIGRHLTGNEVYVRNLLNGFAALDKSSEFIAYISMGGAAGSVPARFQCRPVSANPYLRLGLELSFRLREDAPDLVHVQYNAPLKCPVPVVVSVHDVSYLEHPEYFPPARALQLRFTVRRTIGMAARILTPSEFSRREIVRAYGLADDSVTVVPNAVSKDFRPRSRERAGAQVRARYGIPSPFILTVGDLQPRKNQTGLICAFEELIRQQSGLPHHLVFVGQEGWNGGEVRRRAAKSTVSERIHFAGFVGDEDLLEFYSACELFVFPSRYEGFGLPILEAMACGRAVACSNTSAMPEVADSAAILFDPHSAEEMTRALRDLVLDAELRGRMERLGLQRAAAYSWENSARRTLDVYYSVAGARRAARKIKIESVSVSSR